MPVLNNFSRLGWLALGCFALVIFLGKAYERSIAPNDSGLHALVAIHATKAGPLPHLPIEGVGGVGSPNSFNDQPPTLFALTGWIMRAFGPSAWSARLLAALLAVGCVLLTGALGTLLYNEAFGFISALLLVLTPEVIKSGASFHLDIPMMCFIMLSFFLWKKKYWAWAGAAAGLGVWIKTPVALLVVPVALLEIIITDRFSQDFKKWLKLTVTAVLVVFGLYTVIALLGDLSVIQDYWTRQVWGTAVGGRGGHSVEPFLFFKYIASRFVPWILLLAFGFFIILKYKLWLSSSVLTPLLAICVLVGVLSPMRFKYDYYFLPAFPFLCLLATHAFVPAVQKWSTGLYRNFIAFALPLMALVLTAPIQFGPEMFPSLKRFNALIQTYGTCKDEVLVINGGQPYANPGEYSIEVRFYTGRNVMWDECGKASELAKAPNTGWIIISDENYANCLTSEVKTLFPTKVKFGNQLLLSRVMPMGDVFDLTPLERELKAALNCKPAPLPQDRYHRY